MEVVCDLCNKQLKSQKALDYHKSHNACRELLYLCKYCEKGFATESNMYIHMRSSCKTKKEDDKEKKSIYERLIKLEEENKKIHEAMKKEKNQNKKLQKKVALMKKIVNNTKGIANITNNINKGNLHIGNVNNVTDIILVGYGHEDISKIDKNDVI